MFESLVFLVHLLSTLFMVGVIWFVQLVHYPLFALVGEQSFVAYERAHCARTGVVVIPAMLLELSSAIALVFLLTSAQQVLLVVNLCLLALIWASTFFLQVPAHNRLSHSFDVSAHQRLLLTNWVRTFLWSARMVLLTVLASDFYTPDFTVAD